MSQDVHFTYFTFAPQSYNPSLIGGYAGTYRGSAILREQYNNGGATKVDGYQTIELNVDAPIIKGFRDQDWIGAGISFNRDTRGFFELRDNISRLGLAYHIGLDKKSNSYFSIGAQFVNTNRTIGDMQGLTPHLINTGASNDKDLQDIFNSSGGGGGNNSPEAKFSDWIAGFSYTAKSKRGNFKIGLSGSQFLENKIGFEKNIDDPFKLVGFFQMFQLMNKKLAIEPALLFQSIGRGGGFEVTAHNMFSYKLKPESPLRLKAGLGVRTGSFSVQALLGASYKGFHGGMSYDLPVNGYQAASGPHQAFEIAFGYIGRISKTQ
jgi:type IX secretion system PorP/SprF family membrane protein